MQTSYLKDSKVRSVVKGLTYRTLATFATFSVAFLLTGNLSTSIKVGLIDSAVKFVIYYLNERGWNQIRWGRGVAATESLRIKPIGPDRR